jgi:sulfite reductase (NADPH) flavoprotein alpha-component
LSLPVFAVTGWMMYLGRRTQTRAAQRERTALATVSLRLPSGRDRRAPVLVAFATQTGHAERLALRSAGILQRGGVPVVVRSLGRMTPDELAGHARVLIVAASFGEGEPPDGVRRFMRLLEARPPTGFAALNYGLLALGDRNYARFCGFGHALDDRLHALGAAPLFPLVEVHDDDPEAIGRWCGVIADFAGLPVASAILEPERPWQRWTLATRTLLNDGSVGGPLYEIALTAPSAASWAPGALVEVLPRPNDREGTPLPRRYSVASLPGDGMLQLLVRQERHAWGLGVASGWLTAEAMPGDGIDLRLIANPAFAPVGDETPCLYIGNGSGLAGLRAHLRDRVRAGRRRNWLIFGERQRAHDALCADELQRWVEEGFLARLDLAFSRDGDRLRYVQDHLREAAVEVRAWVDDGAVVFVCGSLQGMAGGVDEALVDLLGRERLEALIDEGRYRRDVY